MKRFLFWPLMRFLFGKGTLGEKPSFTMNAETTQWIRVSPGDVLAINNHVDNAVIGIIEVPIDKEWEGQFGFQWTATSKVNQKVRVTYPDGSEKTFRPGNGRYWVEEP